MVRRDLVVVLVAALAATAAGASLGEILDRFYEARGGLKNLKAIESARISGTYRLTDMPEQNVLLEWKRPDRLRLEIGASGSATVEGFDGETAWVIPHGGRVAQPATGDQAAGIRRQADLMDGPLVDWKAKGNVIHYLGEDELDGVALKKLAVLEPDSTKTTIFLDPDSFLAVRRQGSATVEGARTEIDIFYEEYRSVGGLMMAHTIKTELVDLGLTQWFHIEAFEINVEIPDERFAFPASE